MSTRDRIEEILSLERLNELVSFDGIDPEGLARIREEVCAQLADPKINLKPEEVVRQYGFSINYWHGLRRKNEGPSYLKVGNQVLYERGEIERWFQTFRVKTKDGA